MRGLLVGLLAGGTIVGVDLCAYSIATQGTQHLATLVGGALYGFCLVGLITTIARRER